MYTIKLVNKDDKTLVYDIWDADRNEYVNQISVNRGDKSYKLKNGTKLSNSYEAGAYRSIIEAIDLNAAPKEYSNGWGQYQ